MDVVGKKEVGGRVEQLQWDNAVEILVEKPNSVNKRVAGQVELDMKGELKMTRLIEKVGIRSLTEDGNVNYILQQLIAKNSRKFRSGLQLVAIGKRSVLWIPVAEDEIEGEEVMVNEIKDGKEMASVVSNVGYGVRLVSAESCDMLEVMMVAGGADASCLRPWLLRLLDKVCNLIL